MSIKKNFLYNTLLNASNILIPLVTYPYILRILGPDGIGRVNFAVTVAAYFLMVAQAGIPVLGIKEIAKARGSQSSLGKAFSELFFLNAIMTLAACALFAAAVIATPKFRADYILFIIAGCGIVVNLFSIDWFYSGIEEYGFITARSLAIKLLYFALVFILVHAPSDYLKFASISVITLAVSSAVNFFFLLKKVRLRLDGLNLKKYIKPAALIFGAVVISGIYNKMDVVLLGFMAGEEAVGYYTTSRGIIGVVLVVASSLGAVALPRLSYYLDRGMKKEYYTMAEKLLGFTFFTSVPAAAGLAVFSGEIMMFFGGVKFAPAARALGLIALQVLPTALAVFYALQVILANNDEKSMIIANAAGAAVNITLNLLLIEKLSFLAPCIAIVSSEAVVVLTQLYLTRKYSAVPFFRPSYAHYFIAASLAAAAGLLVRAVFHAHFTAVLAAGGAAMAAVYLGYLAIFRDANIRIIKDAVIKKLGVTNAV